MGFSFGYFLAFLAFLVTFFVIPISTANVINPYNTAGNQNDTGVYNGTAAPSTNASQLFEQLLGIANASEHHSDQSSLLSDLFEGNTSLTDILTEWFKTPAVQRLVGTGLSIADAYAKNYVEAFGVSEKCYSDVIATLEGLFEGKDGPLRMLDAIGKPGSKLKDFQIRWLGSYDECVEVKVEEATSRFSGKYCTLSVEFMEEVPPASTGICVPDSCSSTEIKGILIAATIAATRNSTKLENVEVTCQEKRSLDATAIIAICILSILGVLIVLGTLYDVVAVQLKRTTKENKNPDVNPPAPNKEGIVNASFLGGPEASHVAAEVDANGVVLHEVKSNFGDGSIAGESNVSQITMGVEPDNYVLGAGTNAANKAPNVKPVDTVTRVQPTQENQGVIEKMLLSFSVYSNGVKILSTNQSAGSLGAVNGIRFLSMAWVILGHTYWFCIGFDENLLAHYGKQIYTWPFMGIIGAGVSVDSFFALSGLLVAYLTLRELKKVGGIRRFNWFMYYFHRFWRLTPAYMLVMMVFSALMKYWSSGPMWPTENVPYDDCKYSWWTNLLYVNNFVHTERTCMGWTWYLANDMQFYVLSPLILIPLFYQIIIGGLVSLLFLLATTLSVGLIVVNHHYTVQRVAGVKQGQISIGSLVSLLFLLATTLSVGLIVVKIITGGLVSLLFILATTLSVGLIMINHHYTVHGVAGVKQGDDEYYSKFVYIPCYARMGPYIIGLFTGYLLYRMKCKCRMPKLVVLFGWIVCFGILLSTVYGIYSDKDNSHIFSVGEYTAYHALHRTGWGVAVCWIVFACATGYGGWINEVLSWKAFIPLGRLTFCAYLIHPLVQMNFYMSRRHLTFFNNYELIYLFLGHLVMAYGVAFIVSLAFESPMMGLEKAIFKRDRRS